jgi:O-antigen ligase
VLLLVALWSLRGNVIAPEARVPLWIGLIFILLALLSLIPLPPGLWEGLPGRDYIRRGFDMLGVGRQSLPVSLDPNGTIASLLSIIPPAALFLTVVQIREDDRRRLPWVVIGVAIASIVLGAFQLMGGTGSPLRFYEITSPTLAVGFFANANHLATLALCALPFAGFLAARAVSRKAGRAKRSSAMLVALGVGLFLAVGIAVIGSLAGYGLFPIAAMASALIYRRANHGPLSLKWLAGLAGLMLAFLALALAGPLNEQALSKKAASQSSRREFAARTLEAIGDYAPVGSGLGTFQNIYRLYDDPKRIDRLYVNHAHNDYLEAVLELGFAGLLLIAAFVAWWLRRLVVVWRVDFRGVDLARAATVPIGVVLLHSIVDYPIRTAAIAALFGLACALLVPYTPPLTRRDADAEGGGGEGLRHLKAD